MKLLLNNIRILEALNTRNHNAGMLQTYVKFIVNSLLSYGTQAKSHSPNIIESISLGNLAV